MEVSKEKRSLFTCAGGESPCRSTVPLARENWDCGGSICLLTTSILHTQSEGKCQCFQTAFVFFNHMMMGEQKLPLKACEEIRHRVLSNYYTAALGQGSQENTTRTTFRRKETGSSTHAKERGCQREAVGLLTRVSEKHQRKKTRQRLGESEKGGDKSDCKRGNQTSGPWGPEQWPCDRINERPWPPVMNQVGWWWDS